MKNKTTRRVLRTKANKDFFKLQFKVILVRKTDFFSI